MKLVQLHVVEGDPVKGGCHIKQMGDVLDLNKQAFLDGKERPVVPLSVQPTLEAAQAAMRDLKKLRAVNHGEEKK